jgi:ketosteroid isomerase-like protein
MSNIDSVNALLTAINFDRFAEIEAHHAPDALFNSFRGPTLRSSVEIADWHRAFQRDYADCNYGELEYIEDGDTVVVRATIEAKGYSWRPFTQRVIEVLRMSRDEEVAERRLYAMLRDQVLDKPATQALENATGYKGGNANQTRKTVEAAFSALLAGDLDAAKEHFAEKAVLWDGVYGLTQGFDNIAATFAAMPKPFLGVESITHVYAGEHTALVELGIDPVRPRAARFVRLVDGKILLVEGYWMLREIGIRPDENYAEDRHPRRAILPI